MTFFLSNLPTHRDNRPLIQYRRTLPRGISIKTHRFLLTFWQTIYEFIIEFGENTSCSHFKSITKSGHSFSVTNPAKFYFNTLVCPRIIVFFCLIRQNYMINACCVSKSRTDYRSDQDLYSLSGKTSYRKISWNLEVARFGFRLFQPLWNLTDTSATALPRCLSSFRMIRLL